MNTVVPKPWEKSVNKDLEEWSADYNNITIIDWHKYAKGEKQLFYKDATHPKPEGAKKYAEFILKSIKDKKQICWAVTKQRRTKFVTAFLLKIKIKNRMIQKLEKMLKNSKKIVDKIQE